ncbi:kinase-like protein [Rhizophagus irregularis]|uniref:Kinase-like protein n=1 Tax=Rhizophagus irregularis TaxID=588596 RepID=A0A2I1HLP7_9GLOM|nr:kinase-like protein [Rhizophagus irregularis]
MNNENGGFQTIRIYGVTRDPQNGEYAIVTEFKNGGNLREIIKKTHSNLTWTKIPGILKNISFRLFCVHDANFLHKDLHSGNILNEIFPNNTIGKSVISDFEVLLGKEFTRAADIYGFGMIMSELISGEPPFEEKKNVQKINCSLPSKLNI